MRGLPVSAEILCRGACPWGGGRMCVHTCPRALLSHTHTLLQLRLSHFENSKQTFTFRGSSIFMLGFRLHCQYLGSYSWSIPVDFYWKAASEAVNIFVHVIIQLVRAKKSLGNRSCDLGHSLVFHCLLATVSGCNNRSEKTALSSIRLPRKPDFCQGGAVRGVLTIVSKSEMQNSKARQGALWTVPAPVLHWEHSQD